MRRAGLSASAEILVANSNEKLFINFCFRSSLKSRAGLWHRHCRQMPIGPTTSKGPMKDGCKIFWTYVS